MKFLITLEEDEGGVWVAECPALRGCVSQGATLEEVVGNIRDAIRETIDLRAELGMPGPIEVREVDVAA